MDIQFNNDSIFNSIFSTLHQAETDGINVELLMQQYNIQKYKKICEKLEEKLHAYQLENNSLSSENRYLFMEIENLKKQLSNKIDENKRLLEENDKLFSLLPKSENLIDSKTNLSKVKNEIVTCVINSDTRGALLKLRNLILLFPVYKYLNTEIVLLQSLHSELNKQILTLEDNQVVISKTKIHKGILVLLDDIVE